MLEIFNTKKYDNNIAVTNGTDNYTFYDLKSLIAAEIKFLKNKKDNIVILPEDNFSFIIQFFASLFCSKNIYLITDKSRLKSLDFEYDILESHVKEPAKVFEFTVDIFKPLINFYTSGTSGTPKKIKKNLFNLISEAEDIGKEFDFKDKNLSVISTTTMCHLFGLTFHLMVPLCNGLTINTQNISYPENVDKPNTILVSTPTFLSSIQKFEIQFEKTPVYIITAGSKLPKNVFKNLEKQSNIIEIYGSTESGVIAYKTQSDNDFKVFKNVSLTTEETKLHVLSNYFYENTITLNDNVELNGHLLKFKNRTDRLYKIYEKRINADELEQKLKLNNFVENCYITKHDEKLVCLCALSSLGQKYLLERDIAQLIKLLKQHLRNFSEIIPQKWKFIDEIPTTKAGKINKDLLNHLFDVNLSLPIILNRTLNKNSVTYKIFFYRQCDFFKGHFPNFKLLPGVVQLYLAKEFANNHFNLNITGGQWKRIKFSNIIKPDSIVTLKLEKTEKLVSYEFYTNSKKYSSGVFLCENVFKEVRNESI